MSAPGQTHWNSAARSFHHFGPPLRPAPADVRVMEELVRLAEGAARGPLRVMMWGVTPEFSGMNWPAGTRLVAYDRAADMIQLVWPGDVPGFRTAHCADWLTLPLSPGSFDVAIGDGMFNLLAFPGDHASMLARTARTLSAGGLLAIRFFVRPPQSETPEQVLEDLGRGTIGSFHAFKLRLGMALQGDVREGVRLGDVHDAWRAAGLDVDAVAADRGWKREEVATIDLYRDRDVRHFFASWQEILRVFEPRFELVDCRWPDYELGERCPIAAFRLRPAAT